MSRDNDTPAAAAPCTAAHLSCLVCGQPGTPAVWHEPSGVWACEFCRYAGQLEAHRRMSEAAAKVRP